MKLIAVDVDGTLTRTDGTIAQRTIDVLVEVQKRGIRLCIASGRPPHGTKHIARMLHMDEFGGYLIGFNGGELVELSLPIKGEGRGEGLVLFTNPLPDEVIPYIVEMSRENGLAIISYHGENVYSETPDDQYVHLSTTRNQMHLCAVKDFYSETPRPLGKCLLAGDVNRIEEIEPVMREHIGSVADCFRSDPFYLEIVRKGIDKGKALMKLLNHLNLEPAQLVAFGDGYNDMGMLRLAGLGVAMGNASDVVKQSADMVAPHTDEDGLAQVVEQLLE